MTILGHVDEPRSHHDYSNFTSTSNMKLSNETTTSKASRSPIYRVGSLATDNESVYPSDRRSTDPFKYTSADGIPHLHRPPLAPFPLLTSSGTVSNNCSQQILRSCIHKPFPSRYYFIHPRHVVHHDQKPSSSFSVSKGTRTVQVVDHVDSGFSQTACTN